MAIKTSQPLSFTAYYVEKRKSKHTFLKQLDQLINWETLQHTLEKVLHQRTKQGGEKSISSLTPL